MRLDLFVYLTSGRVKFEDLLKELIERYRGNEIFIEAVERNYHGKTECPEVERFLDYASRKGSVIVNELDEVIHVRKSDGFKTKIGDLTEGGGFIRC